MVRASVLKRGWVTRRRYEPSLMECRARPLASGVSQVTSASLSVNTSSVASGIVFSVRASTAAAITSPRVGTAGVVAQI